jgi:hypothetical protein
MLVRNAPYPCSCFCLTTLQALVFPSRPSDQRIIALTQNRREHRSIVIAVVIDPAPKHAVFTASVGTPHRAGLLDTRIVHGDGTTTAAKKGGDNIGFNGHKKMKGDKAVAFFDRNCNVIAPFVSAPGNGNESPLLREVALPELTRMAKDLAIDLRRTIVSLDGAYDCHINRKAIFNREMIPNINENPRGRKTSKRGRKPFFDADIFKERFDAIERVFAWEDKFKRLLLRFERISKRALRVQDHGLHDDQLAAFPPTVIHH